MAFLLHQLVHDTAQRTPDAVSLLWRDETLSYAELSSRIERVAAGMRQLGLGPDDRVAVYLPKCFEAVVAVFATTAAGGVFVPVNPLLKPEQVAHILSDSGASFLVTSHDRGALLNPVLADFRALQGVVIIDRDEPLEGMIPLIGWNSLSSASTTPAVERIDTDLAAILYTSGSTGRPKGVVLSHGNLLAGAHSVASYLKNTAEDRLLAVLPLSFDYGLSQLTTAFHVGASVVLMEYLLPGDVIKAVARYRVTGLAAVPPLWNQLAALPWPAEAVESLRFITSSGGSMPVGTTRKLRTTLASTEIFLMYGLTEAFRSTYLSPALVDERADSIGRAIPNAEVMIVRPDGSRCDPGEPGELVHRGALVAQGYWGDPAETRKRFRSAPGQSDQRPNPELAVWSGDRVKRDADGFLYFIGRDDEMIKTSGYRVSPSEIEEVAHGLDGIRQTVALGVAHSKLGQAIVLVIEDDTGELDRAAVLAHCRQHLPLFMVPAAVEVLNQLPRSPNGKVDRPSLVTRFQYLFDPGPAEGE